MNRQKIDRNASHSLGHGDGLRCCNSITSPTDSLRYCRRSLTTPVHKDTGRDGEDRFALTLNGSSLDNSLIFDRIRHNKLGELPIKLIKGKISKQIDANFIAFIGVGIMLIDSIDIKIENSLPVDCQIARVLGQHIRFILSQIFLILKFYFRVCARATGTWHQFAGYGAVD